MFGSSVPAFFRAMRRFWKSCHRFCHMYCSCGRRDMRCCMEARAASWSACSRSWYCASTSSENRSFSDLNRSRLSADSRSSHVATSFTSTVA